MKLRERTSSFESNTTEKMTMRMKAGVKAFKVFFDGIYSDKPRSIAREYMTNCLDAHIMVGNEDEPFQVSLPTIFDPSVRFRDFGPGLSKEGMRDVFLVLFESTKDESDDFVGQMGIGSKSAWSYTDTFTVTSYQDGIATYYSMVFDGVNYPDASVMSSGPTDEPNGLEVAVPVSPYDIPDFKTAVFDASRGFDVKPTIINNEEGSAPEPEVILKGEGYTIYRNTSTAYRSGAVYSAKMGCVLYPVRDYDLVYILGVTDRNVDVVVEFPMGDLAFTTSREELSFGKDEPTETNITNRFNHVKLDLITQAQKEVDKAEDLAEAVDMAKQKARLFRGWRVTTFSYCGQSLDSFVDVKARKLLASPISQTAVKAYVRPLFYSDYIIQLSLSKTTHIFLQNVTPKKKTIRAADRLKILATELGEKFGSGLWVRYNEEDEEGMKELSKFLTDHPYFTVHDLEDTPDPGAATTTRRPVSVKIHNGSSYSSFSYNLRSVKLSPEEMDEGGVYLPIKGNYPDPDRFRHYFRPSFCSCVGVSPSGLVCVPKTLVKRFDEHPKWRSLQDVSDEWLAKHRRKLVQDAVNYRLEFIRGLFSWKLEAEELTTLRKFADRNSKASSESWRILREFGGDCLDCDEEYTKLQKQVDYLTSKLKEKYPLLFLLRDGTFDTEEKELIENYIKECEKENTDD